MAKILLIEDDQPTVELMKMILGPRGFEILNTPDGQEALQIARDQKPGLILLDVMLPQLDGYSIQMRLQEDEATKDIPVIITTSKAEMEDVFKTASNVIAFIVKPFSIRELIDK